MRRARIVWAWVRCNVYLLWGMWRGEAMLTYYGHPKSGRVRNPYTHLTFIGASTGSIGDDTIKITRTFYDEGDYNATPQEEL